MNPKEKLPLESNNLNSVSFRSKNINTDSDNTNITSKEAGNEVRNAIKAFEENLAKKSDFK